MINYDLFLLLKEGNEQEFVKGLNELYDEELKDYQDNKVKFQECQEHMEKLSEKIFEKKEYCLNPDAPLIERIDTKLKTDPKSLRLYEKYRNYDADQRIYVERLCKLHDTLMDNFYILQKYGIVKDKSQLSSLFK